MKAENAAVLEALRDAIFISSYYFDALEIERRKMNDGLIDNARRAEKYIKRNNYSVPAQLRGFFSSEAQAGSFIMTRIKEIYQEEVYLSGFIDMHIANTRVMKEKLCTYYKISEATFYNDILDKDLSEQVKISLIWIFDDIQRAIDMLRNHMKITYSMTLEYYKRNEKEVEKIREKCQSSDLIKKNIERHNFGDYRINYYVSLFSEDIVEYLGGNEEVSGNLMNLVCGRLSDESLKYVNIRTVEFNSVLTVLRSTRSIDILNYLKKRGSAVIAGVIAKNIGMCTSEIISAIDHLVQYDAVIRIWDGKNNYYRINKEFFVGAEIALREFCQKFSI